MRTSRIILAALLLGSGSLSAQTVNPLEGFFGSPDWQDRITGSFGVLTGREPEVTQTDKDFYSSTLRTHLPNNPSEAIRLLKARVDTNPTAGLAFTLANLYLQQNDLANARTYYTRAIGIFKDFLRAHANLAFVHFQQRNYPEALRSAQEAVRLGATDPKLFGMIGYLHLRDNRLLSAETALGQAILSEPEVRNWRVLLVEALDRQDKYDQANRLYEELIGSSPSDPSLWLAQGEMLHRQGKHLEASVNLAMVRHLGHDSGRSRLLHARLLIQNRIPELGLEAYLQAMEGSERPTLAEVLTAAESLVDLQAFAEANTLISRIRATFGNQLDERATARLNTLIAYIAVENGQGARVAATLEDLLRVNPLNGRALIALARHYDEAGDSQRAIFLYDRAEDLEAYRYRASFRSAELLVRLHRWDDAVARLRTTVSINRTDEVEELLRQVESARRAFMGARATN